LLGTALRSRHPEVIMEISHHTLLLFGEDAPEGEHLAWQMAACERGAECGPGSDIVFFNCLFENRCQPYEGWIDILRRSGDFPAIETRAREINALIDAGEWEELGFGETISDP
jgi:hypothetical protein